MSINCAAAARGDSKSGAGALGGVAAMLLSEGWTGEDGFGGEGRAGERAILNLDTD